MRYVIVGGAGFVGSHLAKELLVTGEKIIILDIRKPIEDDLKQVPYYQLDVCDNEAVDGFTFTSDDVVVQLAANQYHVKVPQKQQAMHDYFYGTNLVGTKNLLASMEKHGCRRMIFFSTDMTYGKPQYLPVDTKHQQSPFGPYGGVSGKGFSNYDFSPTYDFRPRTFGNIKKIIPSNGLQFACAFDW